MTKEVTKLTEQELRQLIKTVISDCLEVLDSKNTAVEMNYSNSPTGDTSLQTGKKDPIDHVQKTDAIQFESLTHFIKTHSSNLKFYFLKQTGRNSIIEFDFDEIQFLDNERMVMIGNAEISSLEHVQTHKAIQYSLPERKFYEVRILKNGSTRKMKEIILPVWADGGLQKQNRDNLKVLLGLINEFIDDVNTRT